MKPNTNGTLNRAFSIFVILFILIFTIIPVISTGSDVDTADDGLFDWEKELIGSDIEDPRDPGIYVRYQDHYRTLKYNCWETYSDDDSELIIALDRVVVRRGTSFFIGGYTEADYSLITPNSDNNGLEVDVKEDGWEIKVDAESSLGKYEFRIEEDEWWASINIYVIFNPWQMNISEQNLKGYAYNEEGRRDEFEFIYTSSYQIQSASLHPFGNDREERPDIYELAIEAAGNEIDPQLAAARLNRLVAQRNDARPYGHFNLRDACDLFFYSVDDPHLRYIFRTEKEENLTDGDIPTWLDEEFRKTGINLPLDAFISTEQDEIWIRTGDRPLYKIQETDNELGIFKAIIETSFDIDTSKLVDGLTLDDAEMLGNNGVSIHELEEGDRSKIINGWCDEVSISLVSLLRSIGIPSRVVSVHPTPEVDDDLMGHFMVEVWFEESMYETSWDDNNGDWYVLDADEWNARFPSGISGNPDFWMPMGETFSSRKNYMKVAEELFQGRFETQALYVFGPEEDTPPDPPSRIDVTDAYLEAGEHELEYGTLTKLIGRGAGDLYVLTVEETSKLTLTSDQEVNPSIYHSEENHPIIPIAEEGYPFESTPESFEGDEVILPPGTHHIGIYAPQNGDRSVEGNFGYYTLTIEESDEVIEDEGGGHDLKARHIIPFVLIVLWVLSFIGMKYL